MHPNMTLTVVVLYTLKTEVKSCWKQNPYYILKLATQQPHFPTNILSNWIWKSLTWSPGDGLIFMRRVALRRIFLGRLFFFSVAPLSSLASPAMNRKYFYSYSLKIIYTAFFQNSQLVQNYIHSCISSIAIYYRCNNLPQL